MKSMLHSVVKLVTQVKEKIIKTIQVQYRDKAEPKVTHQVTQLLEIDTCTTFHSHFHRTMSISLILRRYINSFPVCYSVNDMYYSTQSTIVEIKFHLFNTSDLY